MMSALSVEMTRAELQKALELDIHMQIAILAIKQLK
jgi:hypothetical protein